MESLNNLKIHIADDDSISSMILEIMLNHLGYFNIIKTETIDQTIKTAFEEEPDVLMVDVDFADNIDGIDAYEKIKEKKKIPVVFMTAHPNTNMHQKAKKCDFVEFITKPVMVNILSSSLEKIEEMHKKKI